MKKALVISLFSTIAILATIETGCAKKSGKAANDPALYPAAAVVTALDRENDLVTVKDGSGNEWQFDQVDDWMCGDCAALLMSDNGTPDSIYDDVIISVRYAAI